MSTQDPEMSIRPERPDTRALPSTRAQLTGSESDLDSIVTSSAMSADSQRSKDVRIVIADDETIFRESLELLLQMREGFDVIGGCPDAAATLQMVLKLKPDVLLLDYSFSREGAGVNVLGQLRDLQTNIKVVLLCPAITPEETIRVLRDGARGIVLKTEPTDLLIECIRKVARDQYWLGNDGLRNLVQAVCTVGKTKKSTRNSFRLTEREIEVVQAVLEGYSNPEIAAELSLSEQTIKHHLSHIFDKLGVYSRVELALFAVNHDINSE